MRVNLVLLLVTFLEFLYLYLTAIGAQNETLRYITKDPSNVQQQPMIPIFRNLILGVNLVLLLQIFSGDHDSIFRNLILSFALPVMAFAIASFPLVSIIPCTSL